MRIRFVVHFADGETVVGAALGAEPQCYSPGAPPPGLCVCPTGNTGWRDLPDKPIARLSLVNPHGDMITLQGYEEYNFMVESLQALGVASYVSDVYLMGARDGKVTVYKIGAGPAQNARAGVKPAPTDPLQVGDIAVRVIDRGKEYLGAETTGWKSASGGMEERNVENPESPPSFGRTPSLRLRSGQVMSRRRRICSPRRTFGRGA